MNINFSEASQWIQNGKPIFFNGENFVVENWKMRLVKVLFPSFQTEMIKKVAQKVIEDSNNPDHIKVGEYFIKLYGKKHAELLAVMDRSIHPNGDYQIQANIDDFSRWTRWGFEKSLFSTYYDFARFLLDTPLGSQMKIFNSKDFAHDKDGLITIVDNEPAIIVEGNRTKFSDIKNRFRVDKYVEERVIRDENANVYTYLENGQGLQIHHPYTCQTPVPVARLTDDAFRRTMETAKKFQREGETTHILQIVSSEVEGANNNFSNLLLNSKHPWIRVILGADVAGTNFVKGQVFDVGFGWTSQAKLPGMWGKGRFRCLDVWNYQSAKNRVVTNIPITRAETNDLLNLILRNQKETVNLNKQLGFNLFRHNCTTFINAVGETIPAIGLKTSVTFNNLLVEVSPEWLKTVGAKLGSSFNVVKKAMPSFIGVAINKITEIFLKIIHALQAIPLGVASFLTGQAFGVKGRGFYEQRVGPELIKTSAEDYFYYLPGILQQWQKNEAKASTVCFPRPGVLAVATPEVA